MQSLSLDMLKRVTDVDVYLDNVLRRKAAADAKNQQKFRRPISSQEIAETDSKLRNQLTRFLVWSQKSKHHSRLKVVTWVICSIMAKTYALLLSDDKIPDEDADGEGADDAKKVPESEKKSATVAAWVKTLARVPALASATSRQATKKRKKKKEKAKQRQITRRSTSSLSCLQTRSLDGWLKLLQNRRLHLKK